MADNGLESAGPSQQSERLVILGKRWSDLESQGTPPQIALTQASVLIAALESLATEAERLQMSGQRFDTLLDICNSTAWMPYGPGNLLQDYLS